MNNTGQSIPVITVDGPSGSGKGSVCQRLSIELGWYLLDSGALYRLVALSAKSAGVDFEDALRLAKLAEKLDVLFVPGESGEPTTVLLDGSDVSDELRLEETGKGASAVAVHSEVRDSLLSRQREFRKAPGLIADGRDMGTVIFTDAPLKVFLTASVEERANRRYKQLKSKGESVSLATLLEDLKARDLQDQNRPVSPLKPAADAVVIDSTTMSISSVFTEIVSLANNRGFLTS